jgi:hypothetical protein
MAAEFTTTLGTSRAVTAPSRRQLVGGSILAALSGAAFGAAVVLPDPGEAASALVNPDARLIALCAEFFRVDTSAEAVPDDDGLRLIMDARDDLVQRISAIPAASAAGLQAKARVGHFLMNERQCPGVSFDDVDGYALALLRELMAGAVNPPARPISPDAELIRLCAECDALQGRIDAMYAVRDDGLTLAQAREMERARDIAQEPFLDAQDPLLHHICDLRATTPEGRAARARTLIAWDKDPCWTHDGCWNSQLIGAIVRDLVGQGA